MKVEKKGVGALSAPIADIADIKNLTTD